MSSPSELMAQTFSYALLTGRDANGKPTMGAVSTAAGRFQPMRKLIRDAKGNDAMASSVLYTATALTLNHRVWAPGDSSADFNLSRRPIAIDTHVDGAGVTIFYKVYFG